MIYPFPEMPSENTEGERDDGKLFRRKINLTLWQVLNVCDIDSYANIYVLLKILRTVALTSSECESPGLF